MEEDNNLDMDSNSKWHYHKVVGNNLQGMLESNKVGFMQNLKMDTDNGDKHRYNYNQVWRTQIQMDSLSLNHQKIRDMDMDNLEDINSMDKGNLECNNMEDNNLDMDSKCHYHKVVGNNLQGMQESNKVFFMLNFKMHTDNGSKHR